MIKNLSSESLSNILDEALIAGISSSLQGEFALKIKKLEEYRKKKKC